MPIRSPEARAVLLRCVLGPDRAPLAPDSFSVHLYAGDPMGDGVELANMTEVDDGAGGTTLVPNGYAAATVSAAAFTPDDMGITATATFGAALEEWSDTATHWQLKDPVTAYEWYNAPLFEPLDVTSAGAGPSVAVTVFVDDDVPGVEA